MVTDTFSEKSEKGKGKGQEKERNRVRERTPRGLEGANAGGDSSIKTRDARGLWRFLQGVYP